MRPQLIIFFSKVKNTMIEKSEHTQGIHQNLTNDSVWDAVMPGVIVS